MIDLPGMILRTFQDLLFWEVRRSSMKQYLNRPGVPDEASSETISGLLLEFLHRIIEWQVNGWNLLSRIPGLDHVESYFLPRPKSEDRDSYY
jgi:hypothetical protein